MALFDSKTANHIAIPSLLSIPPDLCKVNDYPYFFLGFL